LRVERIVDKNGEVRGYILIGKDFREIEAVTAFLSFLRAKNYSPNTVKSYAYDLKYYFSFLESKGISYLHPKPNHMISFLEYLKTLKAARKPPKVISLGDALQGYDTPGGLSANTINRILACVSTFYDWVALNRADSEFSSPLPEIESRWTVPSKRLYRGFLFHATKSNRVKKKFLTVRAPRHLPRPIPEYLIKALLESMNTWRDWAIILLSAQGGLRIGEILGLHFEDISFANKHVRVTYREHNSNRARVKQMHDRVVHFEEPEAFTCLNNYILYERPDCDSEVVFLSNRGRTRGQPLTYQGFNSLFNYHCKKLGIKRKGFTIHALRHTHATKMYQQGMDLLALQKRLGHASPISTQVYAEISNDQLREAYRNATESELEAD